MTAELILHSAGPALSIQDQGRPGHLASGLTRGGAADCLALAEGAALLGQDPSLAAIEMMGMGGSFESTQDTVIALTGATMSAQLDGAALRWNASHLLPAGARLTIGGAVTGTYGYLHIAGGIDTPLQMGARAGHGSAGIGTPLVAGTRLPIGAGPTPAAGYFLTPDDRMSGGELRVVRSAQTAQFDAQTQGRFERTSFHKDMRANRMAVRMDHGAAPFQAQNGLGIVSEVIVTGDIQIAGDGAPFILMAECQTTGGYPRIGTVLPSDLPRVAQAQAGTQFTFRFVSLQDAKDIELCARAKTRALGGAIRPLVRNPGDIADLLSYQLISGAVDARADPFTQKGDP